MRREKDYTFLTLFSPLDLATVLYVLISAAYICFSNACFTTLLPHFGFRFMILVFIVCLSLLVHKFNNNKLLLLVKNLYPLLFIGFFYTETGFMNTIVFNTNLDSFFLNCEQALWKCQPSIEFSKLMHWGWFNEWMNICYFSYYPLIGSACVILYLKAVPDAPKAIFTIIFSFYLYYIIFAIFPVVGPQYYILDQGPQTPPPYFFGKLMHTLISDFEKPTGAFPSSHVGIAIIISYISYIHLKKMFFITLPFVLGICFATVYIKAHYVIDVFAGIISAPLFIILSKKTYDYFLFNKLYYAKPEKSL